MAKYRKKVAVVEAVRWLGFDKGPHDLWIVPRVTGSQDGCLPQDDGGQIISPGWWVVTGAGGRRNVVSPAAFDLTYEPVPEPTTMVGAEIAEVLDEYKSGAIDNFVATWTLERLGLTEGEALDRIDEADSP